MTDTRQVRKDMLVGLVDLHAAHDQLSFGKARAIADRMANETLLDPMLLAWFDRKNWRHSPAIC
jgi:hypothetical protein